MWANECMTRREDTEKREKGKEGGREREMSKDEGKTEKGRKKHRRGKASNTPSTFETQGMYP